MNLFPRVINSFVLIFLMMISCKKDGLVDPQVNSNFPKQLSDLNVYSGQMSDLKPSEEYTPYKLSSPLFTDYAEKQRLIKLPAGKKMKITGDDLLEYPEGTVLVKTFYYYKDVSNPSLGTRIIETRILKKENEIWNIATYLWNENQEDAFLITSGYNMNVNWIDKNGNSKVISYNVPNNRACAACHNSGGIIEPIGPKANNLNRMIEVSGQPKNQLQYFEETKILESFNLNQISALPSYLDKTITLQERARAYLDINCAHCHNSKGIADSKGLFLLYKTSFSESGIKEKVDELRDELKSGNMPLIGTSLKDKEGVKLVLDYLNTL